jgi:recombinational DNA repair protein (RecF pathway)
MVEKNITGIILSVNPFEDEHIVSILTEGGNKLMLKAKGLSKMQSKNRYALQPLNECEIEYFTVGNTNKGRIKRATTTKEFIAKGERDLAVASIITSILNRDDNHNNLIFNSVKKIL